jgi:D-alanyl-D-alanine carboxypeptidase
MNKNTQPQSAAQYKATPQTQQPQSKPPKRRKRIRIKPTKESMIPLLGLLLVVALAVVLIVFIAKGIVYVVNNNQEETTTTADNNQPPATLPWNSAYVSIEHANNQIAVGDLILVNFNHAYPYADSLNSNDLRALADQEGYSSYFVLGTRDTKVRSSIISALKDMVFALVDANPDTLGGKATGTDRIIITSGYRDTAKQTELFEKNPEGYSAQPGHSEHHTGYAVDIQIFTGKGATVLLRDAEQEWMEAHCAEYGFVIRYDGSKAETTGILDEPWHYRYVGVPHATYMTEHKLCLEEYLEIIRTSHTYDKTPLEIKAGEKDYLVYYIPATENATFTSIPVPPASEGSYTISGDNMNGFIVTVEKAS